MRPPSNDTGMNGRSPPTGLRARVLSGSVWALWGRIIWIPLGLGLNAILARLLDPAALGVYFMAASVLLAGRAIGELGLGTASTRLVAEAMARDEVRRARGVVRMSLLTAAVGGLAVAAAYAVMARPLATVLGTPGLADVTPWMVGLLVGDTLSFVVAECLRGYGDIRLATVFQGVLARTVMLIGVVVMWQLGTGDLDGVLALLLAGTGVSVVIATAVVVLKGATRARGAGGDASEPPRPRELLVVGLPLMATTLVVMLRGQFDIWLVGSLHTEEELAVYGTASRLAAFIILPLQAVAGAVSPMTAELHALGRKRDLERMLRTTATLATVPAAIGTGLCLLFGEDLLGIVFGAPYAQGAPVLVAWSLGWLGLVWCGTCGQALTMTGHQRLVMITSLAVVLPTCVVAYVFAPRLGLNGIAYTIAAGTFLHGLISLWTARVRLGVWTHATLRSRF
jgi:O-antigen/teichoic acid export membrane protein